MKRNAIIVLALTSLMAIYVGCKQKAETDKPAEKEKPVFSEEHAKSCVGNLRQLGRALLMYSGDFSSFFPNTNLGALHKYNELRAGKVYVCPADDKATEPKTAEDLANGMSSYSYLGSGLRDDNGNSQTVVIAKCTCGKHGPYGVPTLYLDGHATLVGGTKPVSGLKERPTRKHSAVKKQQ